MLRRVTTEQVFGATRSQPSSALSLFSLSELNVGQINAAYEDDGSPVQPPGRSLYRPSFFNVDRDVEPFA